MLPLPIRQQQRPWWTHSMTGMMAIGQMTLGLSVAVQHEMIRRIEMIGLITRKILGSDRRQHWVQISQRL